MSVPAAARSRPSTPLDILREMSPLRPPEGPWSLEEFFAALIQYLDRPDEVRAVYETFGPEHAAKFISNCHGLAVRIPSRAFFEDAYQNVEAFLLLDGAVAPDADPAVLRLAAERVARRQDRTTDDVLASYRTVRVKLDEHA